MEGIKKDWKEGKKKRKEGRKKERKKERKKKCSAETSSQKTLGSGLSGAETEGAEKPQGGNTQCRNVALPETHKTCAVLHSNDMQQSSNLKEKQNPRASVIA